MNFSMPVKALTLFMVALCSSAALADDGPIVPDQPGLVESSQVVGVHRWQLEAAWAGERNPGERLATTPLLLRAGLSNTVELRFESDGYSRFHVDGASTSGYADSSLGVKWHIADAQGMAPSMAVLAHLDFATGSRAFRGQGTRPSLRLTAEWDLPADFSAGVIGGVARDSDDDGHRYQAGVLGLTGGYAVNERLHLYSELAGARFAKAAHGGNDVSFGAGATYLVANDWQVDLGLNKGISHNAAHTAATVGLSMRW